MTDQIREGTLPPELTSLEREVIEAMAEVARLETLTLDDTVESKGLYVLAQTRAAIRTIRQHIAEQIEAERGDDHTEGVCRCCLIKHRPRSRSADRVRSGSPMTENRGGRYKTVGNLRSLTGQGTGYNVAACRDCSAIVWDTTQHDKWHAEIAELLALEAIR